MLTNKLVYDVNSIANFFKFSTIFIFLEIFIIYQTKCWREATIHLKCTDKTCHYTENANNWECDAEKYLESVFF